MDMSVQTEKKFTQTDTDLLKRMWYDVFHLNIDQYLNQQVFSQFKLDYFTGATLIEEDGLMEFLSRFFLGIKEILLVLSAKIEDQNLHLD